MFKMEGKYTTANVYCNNVEEGAMKQINEVVNHVAFKNSHIAIMPDVHQGAGICIGFTAELTNKVIPNVVGVDIGCGMLTVNLGKVDINLKGLDNFIKNNIPSGFNGYDKPMIEEGSLLAKDVKEICEKLDMNYLHQLSKIGSLGGGNHFIEIDVDDKNNKYLIIHSGSRNFGYKIAKHYQEKANEWYNKIKKVEKETTIEKLKWLGKEQRIEEELNIIENIYNIKKSLRFLETDWRDDYIDAMTIAQDYASLNREIIVDKIIGYLVKNEGYLGAVKEEFETIHNYIGSDNIVRKGAVSAHEGEKILIPFNMGDGCVIAIGKGNEQWNCSAPHGAGRTMSRSEAKKTINFDDYKNSMEGIYSTSIKNSTKDESPMAYKDKEVILDNIQDTVEVDRILTPIYNFKDS